MNKDKAQELLEKANEIANKPNWAKTSFIKIGDETVNLMSKTVGSEEIETDMTIVKEEPSEIVDCTPDEFWNNSEKVIEFAKSIYKKTLAYELDSYKINEDGSTTHLHSDKFMDEHPERTNAEYTEEEELAELEYIASMASF